MRLRCLAGDAHDFHDLTAAGHEPAFTKLIEKKGTLDESLLLQESYAPGRQGQADADPGRDQGAARRSDRDPRHPHRKMRSLPKLIPGVHAKLPGDAQAHVKRIYATPRSTGTSSTSTSPARRSRGGGPAEATPEPRSSPSPTKAGGAITMKLAYWPGCVSRGFTPELHGSMALVAERLGIELVTLDRANCCGAGVIAEHNTELADTLNARTFALAQSTGLPMMNICSTCQGAQSECQQRLDADSAYRAHINEALAEEGLEYAKDKDGFENKNFLLVLVEDYGSTS